jgi:hypothetical protein
MKKSYIIFLFCATLMLSAHVDSFSQEFQKGDITISPGLGLGYYYSGSGFAVGFAANAEFSITDDIAIGPYLAFTRWDYGYAGYDYGYTFVDFGARGSYHFGRLLKVNTDQFDPYAGAFLGFVSSSYSSDFGNGYDDPYNGGVRAGIYAGARWFFSEKFGAFGELGVGLYPILLGVTFKLK